MEVMSGDGSEQWITGINNVSGGDYNVGAPASTNDGDAEWGSSAGAKRFSLYSE
jgi:hypothetical protein